MICIPVNVDNLYIIQQKVLKEIENIVDVKNVESIWFKYIDLNTFFNINELSNELYRINVFKWIIDIAIVVTVNYESPIHFDIGEYQYSLNIPLSGCENTYISFYEPLNDEFERISEPPDYVTYGQLSKKNCRIINKVETSKPLLINTKKIHKFENPNMIPRVMLLIRLKNDFDPNFIVLS